MARTSYRIVKNWFEITDPITKEVHVSEPEYDIYYKNFWTLGRWKDLFDLDSEYGISYDTLEEAKSGLEEYLKKRRISRTYLQETVYTFDE